MCSKASIGRDTSSNTDIWLSDFFKVEGKKTRALSYDIMKRRLDKGLYTRLDHFQEDMFSVFERARRCSKLDSRTYLDAITLQTEYMRIR